MKKNKKIKMNWKNVILMGILLGCCGLIGSDLLALSFSLAQFTYVGIITHFLAWMIAISIYDYLDNYATKKVSVMPVTNTEK